MAETRTLEVLLKANTAQFASAMAAAGASVDGLEQNIEQLDTSIGETMTAAGKALLPFSAALAAVGTAAVGLAIPYDREFTKIESLVGVAGAEVDKMRITTLKLAGETAEAPADLASAMFTIQSAGLRGAEGASALEIAAKSSAIGMGTARDNAQALTGILNAYASSNLTAAAAGDILAATARAGNFEASQLATSIGRVLPNAASLGVAFEDVGGAIALFTRTNGDAAQSVTQLDGLMRAFIKPTEGARDALTAAGTSMQEIQRIIREDGLVAGIQALDAAFGGNREMLAKVIEDSTGLTAAFQILDADAATLESTFGATANAAGILDEAFAITSQSSAFKYDQAMNSIKTSLTALGSSVLPPVASAMSALGGVVSDAGTLWSELPGPVQDVGVALGLVGAAAGPVLIVFGKLASSISDGGGISNGLAALKNGLGSVNPLFIAGAAAVGLAAAGFLEYSRQAQETKERADAFVQVLIASGDPLTTNVIRLAALADAMESVSTSTGDATDAVDSLTTSALRDALGSGLVDVVNRLDIDLASLTGTVGTGTDGFEDLGKAVLRGRDAFQEQNRENAFAIGNLTEQEFVVNALREEYDRMPAALKPYAQALIDGVEAGTVSVDTAYDFVEALDKQADASDDAAEQINKIGKESLVTYVSLGVLTQAQVDAAVATAEAAGESQAYAVALDGFAPIIDNYKRGQEGVYLATEATTEQTRLAGFGFRGMLSEMDLAPRALDVLSTSLDLTAEEISSIIAGGKEYITEAERMTGRVQDQADSFDAVAVAMDPYLKALNAINGTQQTLDEEILQTSEALIDAKQHIAESAQAWDTHSAAGIENIRVGRELGTQMREEILAMIANGAGIDEVNAKYDSYREQLIDVAMSMGANRQQAEEMVAVYFEIPPEIRTKMVAVTADATESTNRLLEKVLTFEGTYEALLAADAADANKVLGAATLKMEGYDGKTYLAELSADPRQVDLKIAAALLDLAGFDDETVTATLNGDNKNVVTNVTDAMIALGLIDGEVATATIIVDGKATGLATGGALTGIGAGLRQADGGVVSYYANGGVENHVAQIAPAGAYRLWAEPETGGEAYIPLTASKRDRSTSILSTVADMFGYSLTPTGKMLPPAGSMGMADGGVVNTTRGPVRAFASGGLVNASIEGVNVYVTVDNGGAGGGGGVHIENLIVTAASGSPDGIAAGIAAGLGDLCGEVRHQGSSLPKSFGR